jgi:hypothetical protein
MILTGVRRKPRRFWSVRPLVMLPHAPGLSHTLPAILGLKQGRHIYECAPLTRCTPLPVSVYYPIEPYTGIVFISG